MYLHLGQDVVVRQQDIIGVFDIENTTVSRLTRQYLTKAEQAGRVTYVNMELPKSFTVCAAPRRGNINQKETVYVSQIAPRTLQKRAKAEI
jgi:hypothetical protein